MTDPIPCPMCGKAPVVCKTANHVDGKGYRLVWMVYCNNFDEDEIPAVSHQLVTEGNHETSEDAIRAWNEAHREAKR